MMITEEMQLYRNMMCENEFHTERCKKCEYYYKRFNNMYEFPRCLKECIRDWALYHIRESEGML